jgi:hypothetical protein
MQTSLGTRLAAIACCAACSSQPSVPAQPVPAQRVKADHVAQPTEAALCRSEADCVVNPVDCSECGRCPDDEPVAVMRAELDSLRAECARHPPVRLNPRAASLGLRPPACSPCPGGLGEPRPLWRALCKGGACAVEQTGTEQFPRGGELTSPSSQTSPPAPAAGSAVQPPALPSAPGCHGLLAGTITWDEAIGLGPDREIRVVAWLWMHEPSCPPCPKGFQCEQCLPPYPLFADRPPKDAAHPARHTVRVDVRVAGMNLEAVSEGQMFVLRGSWERYPDGVRPFVARELTPVSGCPDPLPSSLGDATPSRAAPKR